MPSVVHGVCPACKIRYRFGTRHPEDEARKRNEAPDGKYRVWRCLVCHKERIKWYVPSDMDAELADMEIVSRWARLINRDVPVPGSPTPVKPAKVSGWGRVRKFFRRLFCRNL